MCIRDRSYHCFLVGEYSEYNGIPIGEIGRQHSSDLGARKRTVCVPASTDPSQVLRSQFVSCYNRSVGAVGFRPGLDPGSIEIAQPVMHGINVTLCKVRNGFSSIEYLHVRFRILCITETYGNGCAG